MCESDNCYCGLLRDVCMPRGGRIGVIAAGLGSHLYHSEENFQFRDII
jgi:hypothetical protein